MKAFARFFTTALIITTLASCSLGYERQWRKVAQSHADSPPTDLTGAWEGTWESQSSGHKGTLKAIVTPAPGKTSDTKASQYVFLYKATWKTILTGVIEATHEAQWKGGQCTLSGSKDLGIFGGIFSFTGKATPKDFHADYNAKLDHGVFTMKRPEELK